MLPGNDDEGFSDDLLEYAPAPKKDTKPVETPSEDDDEELKYMNTNNATISDLSTSMPAYVLKKQQQRVSQEMPIVQRTQSTVSDITVASAQLSEHDSDSDLLQFEEVRFTNVINVATQVFLLPIILFLVIILRQRHVKQ